MIYGVWLMLALRLMYLQGYQAKELTQLATRQSEIEVEVPARPADIVDRHGKLLATTVTTPSLFVDPTRLKVEPEFIQRLARILNLDASELSERLTEYRDKRFFWVKRRLSSEEVDRVTRLDWPDGAFGFRDEFLRRYPQDELAAHVLGLRNIDGAGRGGIEQCFDSLIRGRPGRRRLVRDARGRIVEVDYSPEDAPRQFSAVQLTLDLAIQIFAERELDQLMQEWKPRAAAAIVLDPQSGEVLAMASRPTYSPSHLEQAGPDTWKNQAISIIYEPGSTFKPLIVAEALQQHAVARDEVFDCEHGQYRMGGRLLRDVHPHGSLSVADILVKSSNIGMAKIGQRLGNEGLHAAAVRFGFGQPTGIELPGELSGLLRPLAQWNSYSTGSIPMGQEIAVTPLQLIVAHAALANGGRLIAPRLIHTVQADGPMADVYFTSTTPPQQYSSPPRIVTSIVEPEVADWLVQEPLREVVRRGTGIKARIPGYSVFGKTGTAQKVDPETGRYSATDYTCSFICGAPSNHPRALVLVVVDEPKSSKSHFGGVIAAPAGARILQRTLLHLRVPPDQDERTVMVLPDDVPVLD